MALGRSDRYDRGRPVEANRSAAMGSMGAYLLVLVAGTAAAQPTELDSTGLTDMSQISAVGQPVPAAEPAVKSVESPVQLTQGKQGASAPAQLTHGPKSAASPPQLATGAPSALPPTPLSKTSDGRTAAVERVEGEDRCDSNPAVKMARRCDQVIENRAAEFRRTEAPTLSPEQRILIGDQAIERSGVSEAARRLANSGNDATSIEAQGVASIVLSKPVDPPKKKEEQSATPSEEAAAAIVNAILNPPR